MSFAAAICSIVCDGIVPTRSRFFARLDREAMSNLTGARRVGNMKMLLSILRSLTVIKLTMRLAEPLILAFSLRGEFPFSAKGAMSHQLAAASSRHKNSLALK